MQLRHYLIKKLIKLFIIKYNWDKNSDFNDDDVNSPYIFLDVICQHPLRERKHMFKV